MAKKKGFEDTLTALMNSSPDSPPVVSPEVKITKENSDLSETKKYNVDYESLPKTTTTISFRVPRDEKTRLANYFKKKFGTTLAEGVKRVIYEYVNDNPLK